MALGPERSGTKVELESFHQELTEESYSRQEELIFAECDCRRRARVGTLLSKAAAMAGYDYDARGVPYEKLYEKGEVFLLSRIALRIHRSPMAGEVVTTTTWEAGVKGAHMCRHYETRDKAGNVCVDYKSDWILVDPKTRRILRPSSFSARKLENHAPELDCPEPCKIVLPHEGLEDLGKRRVMWSDLDGNGHLYSGNYGDVIWDYLPSPYQERMPREFYLNYSKEAKLGQELALSGFRVGEDEYLMEATGPDGVCFTCRCVF